MSAGNTIRLGAHAFAYQQLPGSWCQGNIGVLLLDDEGSVLLVDTFATEALNRRLRRVLQRLGARAVDVVNTHFHGDHTFGNWILANREIVGTEQSSEMMEIAGDDLVRRRPDIDFGRAKVVRPTRIVRDRDVISANWGQIELREYHGAHTVSDLVVWVPATGLLFAGDIAWNGVTPFALMGSVTGSISALRDLIDLGPSMVVPGHGAVGGPEVLLRTLDYFEDVVDSAQRALATGQDAWNAAEEFIRRQRYSDIDTERTIANFDRAFADLTGEGPLDLPGYLARMAEWKDNHSSAGGERPLDLPAAQSRKDVLS